jgi:glycosyltransferase involved in cell wall biosynthesis
LRRKYVFGALAARSDALDVDGWGTDDVRRALGAGPNRWRWLRGRPLLVAATMLAPDVVRAVSDGATPFALDYHDDPIRQNEALGVAADDAWLSRVRERKQLNLDAFRWHVVPSEGLAVLASLDPDRVIVAGNGTDPDVVRPGPWPTTPAVGMMSGAAPRRGIEELIEAVRLAREQVVDLRLVLWLAATGTASSSYLEDLRTSIRGDAWIELGSAPYEAIGEQLGRVMVQCIPTPPSEYWDSVAPIKLFDAMASGRPVVVTPRRAMRAIVASHECGIVADGERSEDIAAALVALLQDPDRAMRAGENGRRAAVDSYSWRGISTQLADRLVALSPGR